MLIRRNDAEQEDPINLMPLIDMVFLLLIFFLVATTFAREERDVGIQLPGTTLIKPLSAAPQQLIINIAIDGTTKVGPNVYTPQQLAEELRRVAREEPNRDVLIRADKQSLHQYFASVAELCRRCRIAEVHIGYVLEPARKEGGPP